MNPQTKVNSQAISKKVWSIFLLIIAVSALGFLLRIISPTTANAQLKPPTAISPAEQRNRSIALKLECHSGTPPILEFVLDDSQKLVTSVEFDFDEDGITDFTASPGKNKVIFRGVPYRRPGTYHLTAFLHTNMDVYIRQYEVSFVPFRWGVNNFNFANDGQFENGIDFVSKTVLEWANLRFGNLTETQKVLLLYFMYNLYKGSIGRCYGFSCGELYYMEHLDWIPAPYKTAYAIPETDPRIIRAMDYVQNDIVFSNFVSGAINLTKRQDNDNLLTQISLIERSITKGKPIVMGYISRKMHHSMVVFGYFYNYFRNRTTLLTANNWERKQHNNYFSEDAENIVITFSKDQHSIVWHELTRNRYRYPDKIFAIQPRDQYHLNRDMLTHLLETYKKRLIDRNEIVLIIEKTETAYVVNKEGKKTGYSKPRFFFEIGDVSFKKIDYNYLFEIPYGSATSLVLKIRRYNDLKKRYKQVNIFGLFPTHSVHATMLTNIPINDSVETHFSISEEGLLREN